MSTNLILIDSNLKDTDVLLSALNAQTTGILYNYDTTRNEILLQIDASFSVKAIERVAICCHGGVNQFLQNGNFFDLDGSTNEILKNANLQFILDLLETYNVSNIDYLACNSLKYDSWRKLYDFIESELEGVTVGASEDETGNLKYGGNWVMENTGEQVDSIYFNEGLEYYRYLFFAANFIILGVGSTTFNRSHMNSFTTTTHVEVHSDITNMYDNAGGNTYLYSMVIPDSVTLLRHHTWHSNIFYLTYIVFKEFNTTSMHSADNVGAAYQISDNNKIFPTSTTSNIFIGKYRMIGSVSEINLQFKNYIRGYSISASNLEVSIIRISDFTISPLSYTTVSTTGTITLTLSRPGMLYNEIKSNLTVNSSIGTISGLNTNDGVTWTGTFTPKYIYNTDCSIIFSYNNYETTLNETSNIFSVTTLPPPPPLLDPFTITPSNITVESHGTINMTFSDDRITLTDISNSLTVDPSNAGIIENINNTTGTTDWTADFTPNYGLDLTDCSLNFNHSTYGINEYSNTFTIDTTFEILDFSLTPSNLVETDVSATLRVEFDKIVSSSSDFNITLDPSYIATLGTMTDVNGGFVWEGVLTRTPNMNKLGNKLDFDFSYNGVEVSANLVFDVVQDNSYLEGGNLIHKATNILTISNIEYPDVSTNFAIQFTTNDVSLSVIQSNLTIDPSNITNITNTTLTNYGFTLEGQIDASGEHNVSGVKLFYQDFSSNAFDIYSIQDLEISGFSFNISAVTYENYLSNNIITLTLNRSDLTNVDISNSLTLDPSNCGQIVDVSGIGFTREISFAPTLYKNEPDCSLTFHYTQTEPYLDASMTIPFSVETLQQIQSFSLTPENIITDLSSNLEVVLRVPTGDIAPTITIDPSYIAYLDRSMTSSDGGLTWNGTINRTLEMNRLNNILTVSGEYDVSNISFNVVENVSLIKPSEYVEFGTQDTDNIRKIVCSSNGTNIVGVKSNNNIVKLYYLTGSNWTQFGGTYATSDPIMNSGRSFELSDDGSVFVYGYRASSNSGHSAYIYSINTETHTLSLNATLNVNNYYFAQHIALSGDGLKVFIQTDGRVCKVYDNSGSLLYNIVPTNSIIGIHASYTGNRVVFMTSNFEVYDLSGTEYVLYHTFNDSNIRSDVGRTSLSGNGDILVYSSGSSPYYLKIYNLLSKSVVYSISSSSSLFGYNLKTNYEGNIVAYFEHYGTSQEGITKVIKYNGIDWSEFQTFEGTSQHWQGQLLSLSSDANLLILSRRSPYQFVSFEFKEEHITRQLTSTTLDPSNIIYPNTISNFQINFTTNDKTFDDISENVSLTSSVSNIDTSSLALTNHGFRLEGNIVTESFSESVANKLEYIEDINSLIEMTQVRISGGSISVPYYTYNINGGEEINANPNIILPKSQSYTFTRNESVHGFKIGDNSAILNGESIVLTYEELQGVSWICVSHTSMSGGFQFEHHNVVFSINTNPPFELLGCTLTPENLVETDVSAILRFEFNTPITESSSNLNITLDPSYIATMSEMSDVSGGFVWEGVLTRTPNMNKLGNKLDFDFSYNGVEVSANLVFDVVQDNSYLEGGNLINKATNISTISNIDYPDVSTNFAIQFTTNDVSLSVIQSNLTIDPSNITNITNTTLTNYGFTLEGQLDVSGEHNVSGVKLFYEDFSSNAFDIYSIQDLSINEFSFNISSAVTYENYISNNITLTLNRSDLTNADISNSLQISPPICGQIVDVSGSEYTRTISFTPTLYINEPDCSLTFHYTNAQLDASMTIPFSVDTEQQIIDTSLNPKGIFGGTNTVSNFGVKFRLPVETPGIAPDITISPSYIARFDSISALSDGSDTWTGVIHRNLDKNRLYNNIDFSYNGLDISLNFNVAHNPELIVGPREIGDFVECKGIKIISTSDDDFTVSEVQIFNDLDVLISTGLFSNSSNIDSAFIMDGSLSDTTILNNSGEKWFQIVFNSNKKIKEITIYASHSVKIELLGEAPNYNVITNLGQVNVDVSGTINIANASTQSTITRAVIDISLNPSNIVYPDVSSNFEMLFSTNNVSLLDISNNNYLTIDPSNAGSLTNLSLTQDGFKLEGQIEANEKIYKEDCKLKYDEPIDISGEKQLAIKDLFVSSSSIVPKTAGVSSINFEHNVGILELEFTLDKPDLSINDFVLDNSASISNLTQDGLIWRADITFPYTDLDVSVNYDISVNYKPSDSYLISKTYNTYIPIVGDINLLEIYDKVPDPVDGVFDISLNGDTNILGQGNSSQKREKRKTFINRLLDTYKNKLKDTTEKLVMKTDELLGTNSGITKEKIKIIDNFDTNGDKLSDISFDTQELSGDEALYVPLEEIGYSITINTYSSKLKVEKISDTSFNVYENYDNSNPIITKVITYDETGIYDFFQYKIGSSIITPLAIITNITLNPSNLIGTDLSSNLQVIFSQPASQQPIIKIDPSYIAELDGPMTSTDGYVWSGTINRTLEMNKFNNILTVSGEYHTSNISFNVLEDNRLYLPPTWTQMGLDLNGENSGDQFGNSVSFSSDGTIVAIGAKYDNTNGTNSGQVRVYKYNGASWYQLGQDINGSTVNDYCGISVSLSGDGSILAIGTKYNDVNFNDSGKVSVYFFSGSTWTSMGSDIYGEGEGSQFGESVSLSSDGQTVIIGAPESAGNQIGYVQIYKYQSDWVRLGNTFRGVNSYDWCGRAVSISSDGTIIAFTFNAYPTTSDSYQGKTVVYQYDESVDGSWNKLGRDILGDDDLYFLGRSVSLSSNGEILAIGSSRYSSYKGVVNVYNWNGTDWDQMGNDILGDANNDYFGRSISLSSDGNILAIGSPQSDDDSSESKKGYVRLYEYDGSVDGSWNKIGDIVGNNNGDKFGLSVSLSNDGKIVSIGAPGTTDLGHVRIYSYYESIKRELTSTTLTPSDIIYTDSSSNFELLFTTNEKSLDDISGNLQLVPSDIGNLTNLQLAHFGFKLVGNIEAPPLRKSLTNNLIYNESEDVSGESNPFSIYTYPPFKLVNFGLTPENIVGPDDVSSNLQIEFNIPIDTNLNNSITIDPSYIVNLDTMTTIDGGYTWSGAVSRELYMNKLGNKLELNYTDINLSDLSDNAFTASAELLFDVLESQNVLKWEKKTDTSLNETFNETVEISPNGQILAQIGTSNSAKIYHLQSDSTWDNVKTYSSANHLALCDNRIVIATSSGVDVYEYNSIYSTWAQIGISISALNVSNLDISIDGNRVAYVYDASNVGIQEYSSVSGWSSMLIAVPITGNNVKFSPNGSLLGIGTLDSENQNFSNVVLYEYSEDTSSWNLKP